MKKVFLLIISLLLITSCSKNNVKFEAFSEEAFAYDIGDGTAEVNATVRVKGFTQTEKDNSYSAAVTYVVDLVRPDSTIRKSVFKFTQKEKKEEPISDIALESQFILDSTYNAGTYKLIYKISDNNSDNSIETKVDFDLQW